MITLFIITINVVVYILMVIKGVSWIAPTPQDLFEWGANQKNIVLNEREYIRLLKASFIHVGIIHLFFNMYCLSSIGLLAERILGSFYYLFAYLVCAIAANYASANFNLPEIVSCGASGAIMGIAGTVLAATLSIGRKNKIASKVYQSLIYFLVINIAIGFVIPIVDNANHLGGAIIGIFMGILAILLGVVRRDIFE
jgi:rhomboid protease GluP